MNNRKCNNLGKNHWSQRGRTLSGQWSLPPYNYMTVFTFFLFTVSVHFTACQLSVLQVCVPPASFQKWSCNLTVLIPTRHFFISCEHLGWPLLYVSQFLLTSEKCWLFCIIWLTLRERKAVALPSLPKLIRHCGSAVISPAFLNKVPVWSYTSNGTFLFHSGNLLTRHEQHPNCSQYFWFNGSSC